MAENSKIQWTTHTFNPWRGCEKVSPGCANCYAAATSKRNPSVLGVWGANGTRVVAADYTWNLPTKWNRLAECCCRKTTADHQHEAGCPQADRPRVFCASMADVFEDWMGPIADSRGLLGHVYLSNGEWGFGPNTVKSGYGEASNARMVTMDDVRDRLFRLIDDTPNLDWLLLTKRPENIAKMMPCEAVGPYHKDTCSGGRVQSPNAQFTRECSKRAGTGNRTRPNVWIGVSVENQEQADIRIPHLLKVPAAVRFLSCEPLLGPVDLRDVPVGMNGPLRPETSGAGIHWVIVGGESGHGARPCNVEWIRDLVRQCKDAGVACFVKQFGAKPYREVALSREPCSTATFDERLKNRDWHGGDMSEWPEDLRVRETPIVSV